ncbi:MAG: LUD domain-containing protein [Terracidiphilus sp.]
MTIPISSRSLILKRICTATAGFATGKSTQIPRHYLRRSNLTNQERIQLMADRIREYDAQIFECSPEHLVEAIADRLRASGRRRFVVPPNLNSEWLVPGFDWQIDNGLDNDEIEGCDGVVTAAFAGIADSGTIVLHHSSAEGRRVISLLPDFHLCILRTEQLVSTLPEYFDLCAEPPQLATYISGPSATADIEMTRIKGVHGPRFLNVILVRDEI